MPTPAELQIDLIAIAQRTIQMEAEAVLALKDQIDSQFTRACQLVLNCQGRLVVTGIGKSGHIARKIAATLASTGTPALFLHPSEASHGDLGMITRQDVVLCLSNSGETQEVLALLPSIRRLGIAAIAMTGNPKSTLAIEAHAHLNSGVAVEACPLNLAPTSSTTTAIVLGDALAIALLEARGFTAEDFAFSHPGGSLGRQLLLKVKDLMHTGITIPTVAPTASLADALAEITLHGFGMTTIQDDHQHLLGVFTDGDLRRSVTHGVALEHQQLSALPHGLGTTIAANALAEQALFIMESQHITALVVLDAEHCVVGVLHLHDLLRAGLS